MVTVKKCRDVLVSDDEDYYTAWGYSSEIELPLDWFSVNQLDWIAFKYVTAAKMQYNTWHDKYGSIRSYPLKALDFAKRLQYRARRTHA